MPPGLTVEEASDMAEARVVFRPKWERNVDMSGAYHRMGPRMVTSARSMAAVDTGEMRDSIDYDIIQDSQSPTNDALVLYAGPTSGPHVLHNELGTSRMAAQPFLRPGAELGGRL